MSSIPIKGFFKLIKKFPKSFAIFTPTFPFTTFKNISKEYFCLFFKYISYDLDIRFQLLGVAFIVSSELGICKYSGKVDKNSIICSLILTPLLIPHLIHSLISE